MEVENNSEPVIVGDSGDIVELSDSDNDVEDVKEELETIKADAVYHQFLDDVAHERKIPEDEADPDFVIEPEADGDGEGAIDEKLEAEAEKADEDSSDSDTSSSDLFEEAIEDLEVKVPPTSLKEAAARYPPFWRVQDKLRREASPDYKSDEDPDYKPVCSECKQDASQKKEVVEEAPEDGRKSCNECGQDVGPRDPSMDDYDSTSTYSSGSDAEVDEELEDLGAGAMSTQVNTLVEMVDDMAVVSDDEKQEAEEMPHLGRSFAEHQEDSYKSDEDPDYVAPADVDNVSDSASSSDDESSETEEMQE